MAPFIDPKIDELIVQYYKSNCNPRFLYRGSQEDIVKELQAWVVRRQQIFQEQQELREQMYESTIEMKFATTPERRVEALTEGEHILDRAETFENEENEDTARAGYLLDCLKHRGVLWPKLWWRPKYDGGVCSFLGTVDPNFDPDHTLTILENPQKEERFNAKKVEIEARVNAAVRISSDDAKSFPSSSDASATVESYTGQSIALEKERTTTKTIISALNTHHTKWSKIVKAVDSGNFPDVKLSGAKVVVVANDRAESEVTLREFLTAVFGDFKADRLSANKLF